MDKLMPVNTTHELYEDNIDRWETMRDVLDGEDAVKSKAARYLPQPAGRSDEDFAKYIQRAQFFDATSKTANGMVGGVFRKPPTMEVPSIVEYLIDDADGKATPLEQLAKDATGEVIGLGRLGLLVDMPNVPEAKRLDEEREMGAEARLYPYKAESIINWSYARVGSIYQLSRVVLRESIEEPVEDDEFATAFVESYRVLDLEAEDPTLGTGAGYRVRIFQKNDADEWAVASEYRPTMPDGTRMDFIPFTFLGSADNTADVDKPPLIDIANVNVGHYRNSADYEDALFMVGQPTPVITGLDNQFIEKHKGQFVIGSRTAWMLPKDSSATMLEADRDLAALSGAMDSKEGQMIQLGARLIESKNGVEAAETIKLRQSGEASVLASIAENVSRGFTTAIGWAASWMNAGDDVEFSVNTDFFPARLNSADMKELVASWQGGVITYATLFENFVAGEVIAAGTDLEEYEGDLEEEAIKNPAPPLGDEDIDPEEEIEDEDEILEEDE